MGNILIIVERAIVREAMRHFLFPEHRATTSDCWSAQEDSQSHDFVIVDREGLEEGGLNTAEVLRTSQCLSSSDTVEVVQS